MADPLAPKDVEALSLLSVFHYVLAGVQALFASFPILHFLLGAVMVFAPKSLGQGGSRFALALMGGFFMAFSGAWMLVGWTLAVCLVLAGRNLTLRKRYLFCLVVAGIEAMLCIPFGTVLGVLTIFVLVRPSVRQAFGVAGNP